MLCELQKLLTVLLLILSNSMALSASSVIRSLCKLSADFKSMSTRSRIVEAPAALSFRDSSSSGVTIDSRISKPTL